MDILGERAAIAAVERLDKKFRPLGLSVSVSGKRREIVIRGMFPAKPGRVGREQARLSVGLRATSREAIAQAEQLIATIALQLQNGSFSWSRLDSPAPESYQEYAIAWEKAWWANKDRSNSSNRNSWNQYKYQIKTLPEGLVCASGLNRWVKAAAGPGGQRHRFVVAQNIGKLAGIDLSELESSRPPRSSKTIAPRDLPTDEQLIQVRKIVEHDFPQWLHVYDRLLVFGLRNHEVWFSEIDGDVCSVPEYSKTGAHTAIALPPDGIILSPVPGDWPSPANVNPGLPLTKLGQKVSVFFRLMLCPRLPDHLPKLTAYSLRHCYAARGINRGLSDTVMAKFMGHSLQIHRDSYQAWVNERDYLESARRRLGTI